MQVAALVVHVLAALGLVGLVLLQHGKGADMGAAFGSGSAGSLFGSSGSSNFLSRSTAIFALIFFLSSMGLSYLSFEKATTLGVMSTQEIPVSSDVNVPGDGSVDSSLDSSGERKNTGPVTGPGQAGESDSRVNEIPK
jgi:preprotein translocase subunit SecG